MNMKISDTGWLCVHMDNSWMPVIQLTVEQCSTFRQKMASVPETPSPRVRPPMRMFMGAMRTEEQIAELEHLIRTQPGRMML